MRFFKWQNRVAFLVICFLIVTPFMISLFKFDQLPRDLPMPNIIKPLLKFQNIDFGGNTSYVNLTMMQVFARRRQQLLFGCKRRFGFEPGPKATINPTYISMASFDFLFVDDEHRILFCALPKVASTNWRKFFIMAANSSTVNNPDELDNDGVHSASLPRPFRYYSSEEKRHILREYAKIVWVRNPINRLVSAWKSKLFKKTAYSKIVGSDIIKQFRANASESEIQAGFPVRLEEFLRYVIFQNGRGDIHWSPQYDMCQVCIIPYDFIGTFERLSEEAEFVIREIIRPYNTINASWAFPVAGTTSSSSYGLDNPSYLAEISKDILRKVAQKYRADFELFGYSLAKYVN